MVLRVFESHRPVIADDVFVDESAVVLGNVMLGPESSVWPQCVLRGDIHSIQIGARTNIQDGTVIHVTHDSAYAPGGHGVTVGDDVTVGHKVILHGCTIEDLCLIGMGAVVMDGAVVRSGAMVGAGSLVTPGKDLAGGYLWLGSPVRQVRPLNAEEQAYLRYSAEHYVRLKDRHRVGTSTG
jgi:carbonic anhydrase/acetyltransferase-like protein (isoleucine patch superfamily)